MTRYVKLLLLVASCSANDGDSSGSTSASRSTSRSVAQHFYVVHREAGQIRQDLPVWASKVEDPFGLMEMNDDDDDDECNTENVGSGYEHSRDDAICTTTATRRRRTRAIERHDLLEVPGAFQLYNFLTPEEAKRIVDTFEDLGFTEDAAVSVPRSVRHNWNLVCIADDTTLEILWNRCQDLFYDRANGHFQGRQPLGLNGRFRSYKYSEEDHFKLHSDGSWAGTRVVNGTMINDSYNGDRLSLYSFLIFLSDDYHGGETEFWVQNLDPSRPAHHADEATTVAIRTPIGGVLAFPHGEHPLHCLHASSPIINGTKYIIRADVLFDIGE